MKLACIVFTAGGEALASQLLPKLEGWQTKLALGYGENKVHWQKWAQTAFATADALLFIGAAGIAVRAVAPLLKSKTSDPAVLVMDEAGQWVVPLLSGHIGGANRLAKQLAFISKGRAVLTTATDVRGLWAVDEWAVQSGFAIQNPAAIKVVSARLLAGETVWLYSDFSVTGRLPQQVALTENKVEAHVVLSPCFGKSTSALYLVPSCVNVGIGCKRGTPVDVIEAAFTRSCETAGINPAAVAGIYSINLKKQEPGLLAFCSTHGWPFTTYSAEELHKVQGSQSPSAFVQSVTGVDNVCERSALAEGGKLLLPKQCYEGVTVAMAVKNTQVVFEGNNE